MVTPAQQKFDRPEEKGVYRKPVDALGFAYGGGWFTTYELSIRTLSC